MRGVVVSFPRYHAMASGLGSVNIHERSLLCPDQYQANRRLVALWLVIWRPLGDPWSIVGLRLVWDEKAASIEIVINCFRP